MSEDRSSSWIAAGLILLAAVARLLPHPPNVTPVMALSLFAGACLSRRLGIIVPVAAVILSDLVLGLYDTAAFTWAATAIVGLLGWTLRRSASPGRIAAASVAGSTVFFILTNASVWLLGEGGRMYPKTLDGLAACYVAALPFFRNALVGDLVCTAVIFGVYALATRRPAPVRFGSSH